MMATRLFSHLFDDAAIFPPGNAPVGGAVAAHHRWRRSTESDFVGPFVCAAHRWAEATSHGVEFPVSLTLPGGTGDLADISRGPDRDHIVAIETPLAATTLTDLTRLSHAFQVYVEVPLPEATSDVADSLAQHGLALKLRTGGNEADAFPSAGQLALGLVTAVRANLPFKLTGGLHHAVRHRNDATGFEHHGFLNVIGATAAAIAGSTPAEVTALLDDPSSDRAVARVRTLTEAETVAVRLAFRSFGTCSIEEPYADLRTLGLLDMPTPGADA